VKIRRKRPLGPGSGDGTDGAEEALAGPGADQDATGPDSTGDDAARPTVDGPRAQGPWDASEVTLDEDDSSRVDLGGLLVTGRPGLELRLQVDQATGAVASVLLIDTEGAVELRPFAAPRNADIWEEFRATIAAETARRGGTASEADGTYGKELQVVMPVTTPDGQRATQPSRVLGIAGPRWLLRVTLLGRPALQPDPEGELESALRDVVVVRGTSPMAPGDPIPLVVPANAAPVPPPAAP
jgi:hypothetical protein